MVPIRLLDGARVVRARVRPNGLFEITGPLPKASIRETEKARYVAELGGVRSPSVKLTRRMTLDALNLTRTSVTIYGQITKPLPKVKRDIVITERTSCGGRRGRRNGAAEQRGVYRATFRRPRGVDSAIYRLRSRVRVDARPEGDVPHVHARARRRPVLSTSVRAGQRGAPTRITR